MMEIAKSRFSRPKGSGNQTSSNLYVANCGPTVGISLDKVEAVFGTFGKVIGVRAADETGTRVIVCFSEVSNAEAAYKALHGRACPTLGGRTLHIQFSVPHPSQKVQKNDLPAVFVLASDLQIPGIYLVHDFISLKEEQELLAEVDARPWKTLSKRRVQHYGYEFLYETRNVDSKQFLGELPSFVSHILEKIISFPGLDSRLNKHMDQLTVNEYPCGVGLSPHVDTHSAFDDLIFSLSTAGPCIMEFRRYPEGTWHSSDIDNSLQSPIVCRKAIFLPPRSMLLMSGEARYAWHHYIPHHKVDAVEGEVVKRSTRRVSFTFRKVRQGPCFCQFKEYCDSQTIVDK